MYVSVYIVYILEDTVALSLRIRTNTFQILSIHFQIGVCGGWVLAKSQEICVTSRHQSSWKFFNNGILQEDPSFQILAKCTFQSDFFPVPEVSNRKDVQVTAKGF